MANKPQGIRVTGATEMDVTAPSKASAVERGSETTGEGFPVGSKYTAVLVQRSNDSLNHAGGEDLSRPSANTGKLPVLKAGSRKTGKVG